MNILSFTKSGDYEDGSVNIGTLLLIVGISGMGISLLMIVPVLLRYLQIPKDIHWLIVLSIGVISLILGILFIAISNFRKNTANKANKKTNDKSTN